MAGPIEITIRGVTYPSIAVAADALGVSGQAISGARKRGTLDRVGLGRGNYPHEHQGYFGEPITIRKATYASHKEAAGALGVTQGGITALKKLGFAR